MSHFSPLLWLCAVSAAALNSFTALDPTGAYEQYLDALGENTPAIAAFFDAAESGVFPWTIPGVSEPIPSPVPDLLPQPPEVVDPVIPDEPEEPVSQFTTVDASYFDDALFLGDSHTDGFHDYAGLGNATYFTKNGLTVKDAVEKSFIELDGKKVTLAEALGTEAVRQGLYPSRHQRDRRLHRRGLGGPVQIAARSRARKAARRGHFHPVHLPHHAEEVG